MGQRYILRLDGNYCSQLDNSDAVIKMTINRSKEEIRRLTAQSRILTNREKTLYFVLGTFILALLLSFLLVDSEYGTALVLFGGSLLLACIAVSIILIPSRPIILRQHDEIRHDYEEELRLSAERIDFRPTEIQSRYGVGSRPKTQSKKCASCGTVELLPYVCKFCSLPYCTQHRLPERHDCRGLSHR